MTLIWLTDIALSQVIILNYGHHMVVVRRFYIRAHALNVTML